MGYDGLNTLIKQALEKYDGRNNIHKDGELKIGEFTGLLDTSGKPYSARADVPVRFGNTNKGFKLKIIGMEYGEGTGNEVNYQDLFDLDQKKILPQQTPIIKTGLEYEVILPLVDLNREEGDELGRTSLDYIELLNLVLILASKNFGGGGIRSDEMGPFTVYETMYLNDKGERRGDPHAIYNSKPNMQVAGFISFPKG